MFRIKPVKNHTLAKYSFHNSSVQPKENAQTKLIPLIKPSNQIISNVKANPPLKQFVRPQNVNKDKEPKLNNPRLQKTNEKTILKRNPNTNTNNQHKLKIPIANQPLSKQKTSEEDPIKDTLKKKDALTQENPVKNIAEKSHCEEKNIEKKVQGL